MSADVTYDRAPGHVHEYLRHTIMRCEVGSTVYGTGLPGLEDHDEMGVYILPPQDVLGTRDNDDKVWRTAKEGERSTPTDIDLSLYSARKYVRLAAAGNPSILAPLFTPGEKIFQLTPAGSALRNRAYLFWSKQAGARFLGYMDSQIKRMEDFRAGIRSPRSNRPELVAEHGYDTKFAMHALRLGYQGIEFQFTGKMTLPIPDETGELLRSVRRGEIEYDDFMERAMALRHDLIVAIDHTTAPERPDGDMVNALLKDMHSLHWGGRI
jgi:predicted nucleotidyltransferase